jgi:hypothetical protein
VLTITKHGERVESVTYLRSFDYRGHTGWGFSFDCDEAGDVDIASMNPAAAENYHKCMNGEHDVVDRGVIACPHSYWSPAEGRCACGETVVLDGDTHGEGIDCECGRIYNRGGQLLAPRAQWHENGADY